VVRTVEALPAGTRFSIGYPSRPAAEMSVAEWAAGLREEGLLRVHIDGRLYRLDGDELPPVTEAISIFVLIDRLEAGRLAVERLIDSLETALARGDGRLVLLIDSDERTFDQRLVCPRCRIPYPAPEP